MPESLRQDVVRMFDTWSRFQSEPYRLQLTEGGEFSVQMQAALALRIPTTEGRPMRWDEFGPQVLTNLKRLTAQGERLEGRAWFVEQIGEELFFVVPEPVHRAKLDLPPVTRTEAVSIEELKRR